MQKLFMRDDEGIGVTSLITFGGVECMGNGL